MECAVSAIRACCLVSAVLIACGRADSSKPDGREGGACFPNDTCFSPLLCPADMAEIGDGLCMDRYEASLFADPSCTGARFGAGLDDIPSGFPDQVASQACDADCVGHIVSAPSVELYACSLPHIVPTAYATWFQAKRACENVNKTLCSEGEWYLGCAGPNGNACATGDSCAGLCNEWNTGPGVALPTGAMTACEGGAPGLFDVSGNLKEWTLGCAGVACKTRGGSFLDVDTQVMCFSTDDVNAATSQYNLGFRCCSHYS